MIQPSFLMTIVYIIIFVIQMTESTRPIEYLGQIQQRKERRDRKYGHFLIKDGFDIKGKLTTIFPIIQLGEFLLFEFKLRIFIILHDI